MRSISCGTRRKPTNFEIVSRDIGHIKEGFVAKAFGKLVRGKDIVSFRQTIRFSKADCRDGIDFVYRDRNKRRRNVQVKSSMVAAKVARQNHAVPVIVVRDGMTTKEIANLLRQIVYRFDCKIAYRVGDYAKA
jgi:hypothetical protein